MMDSNHHIAISGVVGSTEVNMHSEASTGLSNGTNAYSSDMGWYLDPTDTPSDHYVPHNIQTHPPTWDGGPFIFEGEHNNFCFVCGSSMELFECQTCSTSYHASCMTPALNPGDVPDFWFCPHCVERELHIQQPPTTTYFSPPHPLTPSTSPSDVSRTRNSSSAQAAPPQHEVHQNTSKSSSRDAPRSNPAPVEDPKSVLIPEKQALRKSAAPQTNTVPQNAPMTGAAKGNTGRPRRSYSPPRKKSKYSAFSSEVDKALAVIHKELEASAQVGKAESELRDKIQMLEQELRLKDGQITLTTRELELAKRNGGDAVGLKAENEQLKAHISRLNESLESKDAELRDWRAKLKSIIGE